jgi:hypothetical protein
LALSLCIASFLGACGTAPQPQEAASREELEDFQKSMFDCADKAGEYLSQTQNGKNISELTLGWYIYDILVEIASQDDILYNYFSKKNQDIQSYLKTRFRDQPVEEIAALETLAKKGHPTLRLIARYGLETLRHIPNSDEPMEIQIRDRRELAGSLATLQNLLKKAAHEVVLPPAKLGI